MPNPLPSVLANVVDSLWEAGAVHVDLAHGFELAVYKSARGII